MNDTTTPLPPLPEHIGTIHDDGYWVTNSKGPIGYNHLAAGWPSVKVYSAAQVEEIRRAAVLADRVRSTNADGAALPAQSSADMAAPLMALADDYARQYLAEDGVGPFTLRTTLHVAMVDAFKRQGRARGLVALENEKASPAGQAVQASPESGSVRSNVPSPLTDETFGLLRQAFESYEAYAGINGDASEQLSECREQINDLLSTRASPEPLTEDEWIDLASRHANRDWNSDRPDGFLNAIKAVCLDFAAHGIGGIPSTPAPAKGKTMEQLLDEEDEAGYYNTMKIGTLAAPPADPGSTPAPAEPPSGRAATALHGFSREDLSDLCDGLEAGYPKSYDVGDDIPEAESTTAAAARFIRAALSADPPRIPKGEREAEQRHRMQARFADRPTIPATADFDLPAQSNVVKSETGREVAATPAYACMRRANGEKACSRWCGDLSKCIAATALVEARIYIEKRYTDQGAAAPAGATNPYVPNSGAAKYWQNGYDRAHETAPTGDKK